MLKDIATISTGYLFRYKPDYVTSGGLPVIQMKDVVPGEPVNWDQLDRVLVDDAKEVSFATKGDILVKSKGANHLGTVVGDPKEPTLVSSHIIIVRVTDNSVLPGYLTWYLNQSSTQQQIDKLSAGTSVRHLSIKSFGDLPVEVPDMETQNRIANMCQLWLREKQLVEKVQELREQLINGVMLKSATNQLKNEEIK